MYWLFVLCWVTHVCADLTTANKSAHNKLNKLVRSMEQTTLKCLLFCDTICYDQINWWNNLWDTENIYPPTGKPLWKIEQNKDFINEHFIKNKHIWATSSRTDIPLKTCRWLTQNLFSLSPLNLLMYNPFGMVPFFY